MKIGFTGAYCTANFGDYAILINNIYDIYFESAVIFTYSNRFPHCAVQYYCREMNIEMLEVHVDEKEFDHLHLTPFECLESIRNKDEMVSQISKLDVLCVSGGGWLDDNWCGGEGRAVKFIKTISPVLFASQLGIPIVFMAQGVGPITVTRDLLRYFVQYLNNATFAVRDTYCSSSYLNDIGIDNNKVLYLPDDLLFVNQNILKRPFEIDESEKYIVLIVHEAIDFIEANVAEFQKFELFMRRHYGVKLVIMPFDLDQFGYRQSKYMAEHMQSAELVDIQRNKFLPIEVVYNYIKNAQLVITGRYHASIVAIQTKTPFIIKLKNVNGNIEYSYNKAYGSLKNVFNNMVFDEMYFMKAVWKDVFESVKKYFHEIRQYQLTLYDSEKFKENMDFLKSTREAYIEKFFGRGMENSNR